MSKYNFNISNYHAIGHADIEIEGITVIAGCNGCGKSTMSRWLYYIVNTLSVLDSFFFSDFRDMVIKSLEKYSNALDDISNYLDDDKKQSFEHTLSLMTMATLSNGGVEKLDFYYKKAIGSLDDMLVNFLQKEQNPQQVRRVLNLLGITDQNHVHEDIERNAIQLFSEYLQKYENNKKTRPLSYLKEKIASVYREKDSCPSSISFKEDEVELLVDRLGKIYSLDNAIYVGTPAAISLRQSDRVVMTSLAHKVVHVNEKGCENSGRQDLLHSINKMIDGSIVEKENFDTVDLVYRSRNGKEIRLEDLASGFKPMVYMLRLIENGWLTDNTLLEIDEPETNLHPQWVVELAHLLVCINKTFGTKIFITSHNPDMVSAIRYISEKAGVLNTTRFYLAEQREGSDLFDYKDLGSDIEPVFESFNKSFDTLQKYVENYGEI